MDSTQTDTVVLIHGLWLTALSWEHWTKRYTDRGLRVISRSWPGMEGDIDELRRDPSAVAGLGIGDLVDHYEAIIRELERPPIIIGHSFGGLITEILLDRGLGAAGVAIAPAAVKGVLVLPLAELRSGFPALKNPFDRYRAVGLTLGQFHYSFTNHLSEEATVPIYERYAVPGPNHVVFQSAFANFNPHAVTTVNFHNDSRAPLLLVAGGLDHTSPAAIVKANYNLFNQSTAVTEYREYPDRVHFTIGQDGWEEVADYSLDWALAHAAVAHR